MNKDEKAEKKKILLEPSGVPEKDKRLLHLLEMELTLKAKKFESGGRVDVTLEKEIEKKLLAFVTRCTLASIYYHNKEAEDLPQQYAEKARTFGTESSPLKEYASTPLVAAKLYSLTWSELVKIYALFEEKEKLPEAHQKAAFWASQVKHEKKVQRLAKARTAGLLARLTQEPHDSGETLELTVQQGLSSELLSSNTESIVVTPPEDSLVSTHSEAITGMDLPKSIAVKPSEGEELKGKETRPKPKRVRKKLKDIDNAEGDFLVSEDLTTDSSPSTVVVPTSRKKRHVQLAALKASTAALQKRMVFDGPPTEQSKTEAELNEEKELKEKREQEQEGVKMVAMLSPKEKPGTPVILGPSMPDSMLEDAKQADDLQAFNYCVSSPSKTGWTDAKIKEATIAVSKGREAHFRMLAKEGKAYFTQDLVDKWLRVAATAGAVMMLPRLISEHDANANWKDEKGRSILHHAVRARQHAVVEELLNSNANINAADANERTPLHLACVLGDTASATTLISSGCSINGTDRYGNTALRYAMKNSMTAVLNMLAKQGALNNHYNEADDTIRLLTACKKGEEDVAVLLIEHTSADLGYSVEATPLHYACINEMPETVTCLLLKGVAIDPISAEGLTPLHIASCTSLSITRLLLNNNAEPGIEDSHGNIALHYACRGKQQGVAKMLITRAQKYINHKNHSGITPLHQAVSEGLHDIVQLLASKKAVLDAKDSMNNTPLHLACSSGMPACAAALIHAGACLDPKNHCGYEPLIYTCCNCMSDIAVQLLTHQCNVNPVDRDGFTALHYACANGLEMACWELLKSPKLNVCAKSKHGVTTLHLAAGSNLKSISEQLLLRGCNIDAVDRKLNTALHYACLHQCPETSEYLISAGASPHVLNASGATPLDYATMATGNTIKYTPLNIASMTEYSKMYGIGAKPPPIVSETDVTPEVMSPAVPVPAPPETPLETPMAMHLATADSLTVPSPRKRVSIADTESPSAASAASMSSMKSRTAPVSQASSFVSRSRSSFIEDEVSICTESGSVSPAKKSSRVSMRRYQSSPRGSMVRRLPSVDIQQVLDVPSDLCSEEEI